MTTLLRWIFTGLVGLLPALFFSAHALAQEPPEPQKTVVQINGKTVLPSNGTIAGTWFFHDEQLGENSPQLLMAGHAAPMPKYRIIAVLNPGDTIRIIPGDSAIEPIEFQGDNKRQVFRMTSFDLLDPERRPWSFAPVDCSPELQPEIEQALVEHDWRMQDGIDTPLEQRTYEQAIRRMLPQMESLIKDLADSGVAVDVYQDRLKEWKRQTTFDEPQWAALHRLRRDLVLANPLFDVGPMVFAKHVPSTMSHQLTQTYGYTARPGGGLFVLEKPGVSMQTTSLTDKLPEGSYAHPEVRYDGQKIYFAFCEVNESPHAWRDPNAMNRWYHLYEMNVDGTGLQKLTDGEYDDFNPTCLPDGKLVFISTRRGGFHRCGAGPCYVYTLATMDPDAMDSNNAKASPKPISFHETNEWDPSILPDGRILYTRWDYVDRDAVFYQQLWSARQDGTNVRIYYGNNTFVPCGIWESRPIPGSEKVMAIAGPHHGMSAGSVIMLDTSLGVDGPEPITRITPDARFPESELPLAAGISLPAPSDFDSVPPFHWDARTRPGERATEPTEQELRWIGHCYKSPWPLSEKYFIVSYSYDKLVGEAGPNIPNQYGIYFMDVFGNKELIYRDPNISSVWAKPLAARQAPPTLIAGLDENAPDVGTFYLQNVYESWPKLPQGEENRITALRLVQVLPKTTPNANSPMVGAAFASPGKQVLGTVPVEEDGSAFFEFPANTPVLFQALDAKGQMVQTMRSLAYLQPGENMSCIGCHENRMQTFTANHRAMAIQRPPSQIKPGPDGSKPLSYPILVQPVLDNHCVSCHSEMAGNEKSGGILLTGEPDGAYTKSYNALITKVSYTAWSMPEGNYEPLTEPNRFGERASELIKLLENGHYDVDLSAEDWERLNTWIGANALFYGTFNVEDQRRQQRGERIEGPDLE